MTDQRTESLGKLVVLMDKLRSECPWDAKQTHTSLRPHLLEETYEVLEALDYLDEETGKGTEHLKEELGDLLLHIVFHSRIAEDRGHFDLEDVANEITENDTLKQWVTSCHDMELMVDSKSVKINQIHDALILDGKVKMFFINERLLVENK